MIDDVIRAIGARSFGRVLFDLFRNELSVRQLVAHLRLANGSTEAVLVESDEPDRRVDKLADLYVRNFRTRDPLGDILQIATSRQSTMRAINATEIQDVEYRDRLFLSAGIVGKLSFVQQLPDRVLSVSFYRDRTVGPFTSEDTARVSPIFGSVLASVERHIGLTTTKAPDCKTLTQLLQALPCPSPLSGREASVCARVLMGLSNEGAALDLGVSLNSIATYRRRAYAKLNISSQSELFSLVLKDGSRHTSNVILTS